MSKMAAGFQRTKRVGKRLRCKFSFESLFGRTARPANDNAAAIWGIFPDKPPGPLFGAAEMEISANSDSKMRSESLEWGIK